MDPLSSISTTRRKLQQKNARLNARRRLLFKRQRIEGNDVVARRFRLLAREARHIRSRLMRLEMESSHLQQQPHQQHPFSVHNIDSLDEGGAPVGNLESNIPHSMQPMPTEHMTTSSTLIGWTRRRARQSFSNRWDFGLRTTTMWIEERVINSSITSPRFNFCCQSGQVSLPLLPATPEFFESLLSSRHFLDNIRVYNSMFSFTSMGGRIDNSVNDGRSPYVFRINGSNHHKIGSLLPQTGLHPTFTQLYIYDTRNEVPNRVTAIKASGRSSVGYDIVQGLQQMLDSVNPYVAVFRRARDMFRDHGDVPDLRIRIIQAREGRQYITPMAYDTVTRFMIYGPCASCLVEGKCSKSYAKRFCNQTTFDEHGFAQYRRRRTPQQLVVNGRDIDNQWVVPYNRDLCVKYDAHINVERVAVRSVIKYLYKYVRKGHDRATVVIEGNTTHHDSEQSRPRREGDEIQEYLDCRYISAVESCWRIFEFSLQHQYPSVQKLQYHLPGEQLVVFNDTDDLIRIADEEDAQKTMLTMWFDANKKYPQARHITYLNFSTHWVWNQSSKRWMFRQKGTSIGRLPFAHPHCGEQYYLRMLLTKICGATSFEDIRTINGVIHRTFKSACMALGLLDDDGEWHDALNEASTWASGVQLRNMFCSMLMFYEIADPFKL